MAKVVILREEERLDDLTPADEKVYKYLKDNDFVEKPWSTGKAARALKMSEDEVYLSLCNLAKYKRNNIHIHYRDGSIRIGAN